jgi:hypothetical protein
MVKITDRPETPEEILFATEGGLFFIPKGEVMEYGATADLPASAVFAGTVKTEGITESISQSTTPHKGWAGGRIYRNTVDSADVTINATLMEYIEAVADKYFGAAVNAVTGGRHFNGNALGDSFQAVIVAIDDYSGKQIRQWFPNVQVTSRGDRVFNGTEATGFDITLTASSTIVEGVSTHFVEWKEDEVVAS